MAVGLWYHTIRPELILFFHMSADTMTQPSWGVVEPAKPWSTIYSLYILPTQFRIMQFVHINLHSVELWKGPFNEVNKYYPQFLLLSCALPRGDRIIFSSELHEGFFIIKSVVKRHPRKNRIYWIQTLNILVRGCNGVDASEVILWRRRECKAFLSVCHGFYLWLYFLANKSNPTLRCRSTR